MPASWMVDLFRCAGTIEIDLVLITAQVKGSSQKKIKEGRGGVLISKHICGFLTTSNRFFADPGCGNE